MDPNRFDLANKKLWNSWKI